MTKTLLATALAAWVVFAACRTTKSGPSSLASQAAADPSVAAQVGSPELAGFAWDESELAECFSGRAGATVFVWKSQKTLTCHGNTATWN